jgi:Mrp family chromosome partitioning ATPase
MGKIPEGAKGIMKTTKSAFQEDEFSAATTAEWGSVYHTLLYTIFQRPREEESSGMVVALTSANPHEGVTHITRRVAHELAKSDFNTVARIDARFLRKLYEPTVEVLHRSLSQSASNVSELRLMDTSLLVPEGGSRWDGSWQYRRDCIDLLRFEFDYSLIDCPSLGESGDLLSLAPFVDGVILIVEANRTRREQILQAERAIEAAQGKMLGHILNKRTNEVPGWIDRKI